MPLTLALQFRMQTDQDDSDDALLRIVRVFVPAAGATRRDIIAPRSIFDAAAMVQITTRIGRRVEASAGAVIAMVVRSDGVTRCIGAAYPARQTPCCVPVRHNLYMGQPPSMR